MNIKTNEITSRRAVLQLAAEIIADDMKHEKIAGDRMGCCGAFNRLRAEVENEWGIGTDTRQRRLRAIRGASQLFRQLYMCDNAYSKYPSGYWMGSRDNAGMQRRITALLTAAEVVWG